MMEINTLIKDNPSFHVWGDGSPANFGVSNAVVQAIQSKLKPQSLTLETGSGKSTFAFLLKGCQHISIAPDPGEGDRIKQYCLKNGLSTNYTFIAESSAKALPSLITTIPSLDFVFIDGAHRYPFAEIDYHFTEQKLKVGGYMVIDDVHMPSVKQLYRFLKKEKNWNLDELVGNTAFFIKTGEEILINDWQNQGINKYFLHYSNWRFKIISLIKAILGRK
jgi:precorrin-6B methylase 2